uniref:Interleukin 7 receptor n=1 Tax=Astyanax mexicanus TaxID=7994 RepID=A0A3B1JRX5_ASTMX
MMEGVSWIFLILCPLLAHSQSGDGDAEPIVAVCSSMISSKTNNLTCEMNEEDIDSIQSVKLCFIGCTNGTLGNNSLSFVNIPSPIGAYELQMYLKGGGVNRQKIDLVKIVKIPVPLVKNVTFKSDRVLIYIKYKHDLVDKPTYQVQVWGAGNRATDRESVSWEYHPVNIAQLLKGNGVYHVRVRASPENSDNYFNGSWTAWSPVKKFEVHMKDVPITEDPPYIMYIILCTSMVVVIGITLVILRWKKKIKAYISPNIPNPKATLAHIHREKERPPVSFSPEIFNDISINRVDYAEEKQLDPDLEEEAQDDTAGSCQSEEEEGDEEDSSTRVEEEMSHLKIKLLDQPEQEDNQVGRTSVAGVRRDCRDESYVTMSSLYRTE